MSLFTVDSKKCIACGACAAVCPSGLIALGSDSIPKRVGGRSCIACGHCTAVCPTSALDNRKTPLALQLPAKALPDKETLLDILRARRSVRCYKPEPLSDSDVKYLLQAASYAPVGSNLQNISYLVINNKDKLDAIKQAVVEWMRYCIESNKEGSSYFKGVVKTFDSTKKDMILRDAPTLIVATAKREQKNMARINCGYAFSYISLMAQSMGIGTCVGGFVDWCYSSDWQLLEKALYLPEDVCAVGFLLSGYSLYNYKLLPTRFASNVYIEH